MNSVKNSIGWADYTINPIRGLCPVGCSYCYARRIYKRFKWDETIRWDDSFIGQVEVIRKPSRIFVGSTMELFGEWVEPGWLNTIFRVVESHPQHTFIFLTKRPENLARWSPFPPNCWVGYSATDSPTAWNGMAEMVNNHVQAKVKFASFEPLLGEIGSRMMSTYAEYGINWLIIGQQTPASPKTAPKIEWIREIVEASDKAGIPVFLKNNLSDMELPWNGDYYYEHGDTLTDKLRQEFPEVK